MSQRGPKKGKTSPKSQPTGDTWQHFLHAVTSAADDLIGDSQDELSYRGNSRSDYLLLPSLFRTFPNPNDELEWDKIWALESDLYWEFSARARELHAELKTDWDYLFAMQHYRTPTRLLDWTEVLGVAIYFAIADVVEPHKNRTAEPSPCIWLLNPYELNRQSTGDEDADLFAPENIGWDAGEEQYYSYGELLIEDGMDFEWPLAIYPRQTNARVHAQRAWFTMHGDEFVPLESLDGCEKFLRKVELPFDAFSQARRFLEMAGIDHYLLFADLENLSRRLREKFSI